MNQKQHKMMLQNMFNHYTMLFSSCGHELAFTLAQAYGSGFYKSFKADENKLKKSLAN